MLTQPFLTELDTRAEVKGSVDPLGAMAIREPIADWVRDKSFQGGLTYSGHPLACATGVASIEAFREEGIVENAAAMGNAFDEALKRPAPSAAEAGAGEVLPDGSVRYGKAIVSVKNPCPPGEHYEPFLPGRRTAVRR